MELSGTLWRPSNPILASLNLPFPHITPSSRRINLRDLYACLNAHGSFYNLSDVFERLVVGIVEAVRELHVEAGVCHGDLKLQNILVDEKYRIKIVDMSASRYLKNGLVKNFSGSSKLYPLVDLPFLDEIFWFS
jgi:serine/threonine protein kinase